jgi:hypothetical protein
MTMLIALTVYLAETDGWREDEVFSVYENTSRMTASRMGTSVRTGV